MHWCWKHLSKMPREPVLRNTCHGPRTSRSALSTPLPHRAFHSTDHVQQNISPTDNPPPSARRAGLERHDIRKKQPKFSYPRVWNGKFAKIGFFSYPKGTFSYPWKQFHTFEVCFIPWKLFSYLYTSISYLWSLFHTLKTFFISLCNNFIPCEFFFVIYCAFISYQAQAFRTLNMVFHTKWPSFHTPRNQFHSHHLIFHSSHWQTHCMYTFIYNWKN